MILLRVVLSMFSLISINHCERWYSATLIETDKNFRTIESKQFKGSHTQITEEKFSPDSIRSADHQFSTEDTNRWRFMKRRLNKNDSKIDFQHQSKVIPVQPIETTRVKPKKIRKRCPESCSRKNVRSNETRSRFLEVFHVVQFDNVPCTSSSGLEGTCLHEYECLTSGGTGMGSCADGYGTCCVSLLPCDSESSLAIGWFTNPGYPLPSSDRLSCAVALSKASEDIVQIRLDFTTFEVSEEIKESRDDNIKINIEIGGNRESWCRRDKLTILTYLAEVTTRPELLPPTDGICQEDQFIVSGQNVNNVIPILCGINTGQHVYVEVGEAGGPIYLSIQTANSENRLFSIKVTQLASSDDLTAPPGCLQYFTEPKGYFESFNYRDKSDIAIAKSSSYLNNLNYAMCLERVPGSCSVTYTNVGYLQIVNYDTEGLPVIPPGQAGVEIFNCPSDWLLISATRLCGERLNDGSVFQDFSLNAPITDSSAGPIVVWFRSDEGYVGRGFKIQFEQNSCMST